MMITMRKSSSLPSPKSYRFLYVNNSVVTYYIIANHKFPLFLFFQFRIYCQIIQYSNYSRDVVKNLTSNQNEGEKYTLYDDSRTSGVQIYILQICGINQPRNEWGYL